MNENMLITSHSSYLTFRCYAEKIEKNKTLASKSSSPDILIQQKMKFSGMSKMLLIKYKV